MTEGDWHAGPPAWSPDGTRLAFAAAAEPDADRTLRSSAYIVDASGGAPQRVGPGCGVAGPLLFPADGRALLVADGRRSASATPLCCGSRSTIPTTPASTWPPLWTAT